jgi:hypothetical protein
MPIKERGFATCEGRMNYNKVLDIADFDDPDLST